MSDKQEELISKKLRNTYIIALTAIALTFIASQLLVQNHLSNQIGLSEEINKAGRQRMLSQKITKNILLLGSSDGFDKSDDTKKTLEQDLSLWKSAHNLLKSEQILKDNQFKLQIDSLFTQIEPHYQNLFQIGSTQISESELNSSPEQDQILQSESQFLILMDQIVNLFDKNGEIKVQQLRRIELLLFCIGIGILFLEYLLLFRPGGQAIKGYINKIQRNNKELESTLHELNIVKDEKVKLNHELSSLNDALTFTISYATVRSDHSIIHISKLLLDWMGHNGNYRPNNILDIIAKQDSEKEYLKAFLDSASIRRRKISINLVGQESEIKTYEIEAIPMNTLSGPYHLLIILNDITEQRNIQSEIDQIREAKFEAQIKEQKARSLLIIEAQENERKRIARDLHDGVGQSLTALKFQVQSIGNQPSNKISEQISDLNKSIGSLIKEVRLVTFNLVPPELSDYGLITALHNMVDKVNKESDEQINLIIEQQQENRLEPHIETNLYRVTQEGLNNALKYSKADLINIIYNHNPDMLSISIEDHGIGFDTKAINPKKNGSGMGLEFMKERMAYLNGRLFIDSASGQGTLITLNMKPEYSKS